MAMTASDLANLPPVISISVAAQVLDVSKATAYEYAREGSLRTLQFNNRRVVPTAWLMRLLEIDAPAVVEACTGSE